MRAEKRIKSKALKTKRSKIEGSPSPTPSSNDFKMVITDEMQYFLDLVDQFCDCIFLTGKAGTGKSSLLHHLLKTTTRNVVVAAPTGVAAVNVGGVTLHSLFQLPFGPYMPNIDVLGQTHDALDSYKFSDSKKDIIRNMDLLVIDEVSMLRADVLDAMNDVLCHVRRNSNPFGGVQVVFIGDLYQLPPVVKPSEWNTISSVYETPYFFSAIALRHVSLKLVSLSHVFRQSDELFISLLNEVRSGQLSESSLSLLGSLTKSNFKLSPEYNDYIMLTSHNAIADNVNRARLSELQAQQSVYTASVQGNFNSSAMPADCELTLKIGAKVMILANDNETHLYHNGSIGIVTSLKRHSVYVRLDDSGLEIEISKHKWTNNFYNYNKASKRIEVVESGSFSQLPLRLAWAVTIHKSQGMTFDKLVIDAERSFISGQVYVALSRATGIEHLILSSPIRLESLRVEDQILNFYNTLNGSNGHII